jgi:hypothetical protein
LELGQLLVCDIWWNFDFIRGGWSQFKDGAAYNIKIRKNDQARFGHQPRIGIPRDGRFDVLAQTREACRLLQIHQQPGCDRRTDTTVPCRVCPPLFPDGSRTAMMLNGVRPVASGHVSWDLSDDY